MRILLSIALLVTCAPFLSAQAEWPKPNWEKIETLSCRPSTKSAVSSSVGKYRISLVPVPGADSLCRGYLIDSAGRQTLPLEDWGVSIHQGTGEDIFGNGNPGLVLEGYSGGAHCCYTYVILSLGDWPIILRPIKNESPFFFFKEPASRHYKIMTSDGGFDYFDGLCHACTPFPRVVLQIDRLGLHDVGPSFTEQYDTQIAAARAKIAEGDVGKFLESDFNDAGQVVLEIVFCYLYSGREAQAWQTLDEMWPAPERDRIRKLIVETRAKGLLSRLKETPRNIQ